MSNFSLAKFHSKYFGLLSIKNSILSFIKLICSLILSVQGSNQCKA